MPGRSERRRGWFFSRMLATVIAGGLMVPNAVLPFTGGAWAGSRATAGSIERARPAGPSVPFADFNGDGSGDIAVTAVSRSNDPDSAGAVYVFYGGASAIDPTNNVLITEQGLGLSISTEDFFGSSIAAGDFDGDGFTDLAIGIRGRAVSGIYHAGTVVVVKGSSQGLDTSSPVILKQGGQGATDTEDAPEASDGFGGALAVGNFGGSGLDDLAVGSFGEGVGQTGFAGAVSVFFGSSSGLRTAGHQFFTLESAGVPGSAAVTDYFGSSLAAGDFGHSSQDDLAVGASSKNMGGFFGAGTVTVLYGSSTGLRTSGAQSLKEGTATISSQPGTSEYFGNALAVGDFGGTSQEDLAIGAPGDSAGSISGAGAVYVLHGSSSGLDTTPAKQWTQNNDGAPGAAEKDDAFGWSLAAADFGGAPQADLAVGTPDEDEGSIPNTGAVVVLYGSSTGLTSSAAQLWQQDSSGVKGVGEANDGFGVALSAGTLAGGPKAGLVVGVPQEDVGSVAEAGAVNVLYGSSSGITSTGNQIIDQATTGVPDDPIDLGRFGDRVLG